LTINKSLKYKAFSINSNRAKSIFVCLLQIRFAFSLNDLMR
jgi:hypothetical protein